MAAPVIGLTVMVVRAAVAVGWCFYFAVPAGARAAGTLRRRSATAGALC
ncbi:hypothetical protein [Streptomyces iakyrus]